MSEWVHGIDVSHYQPPGRYPSGTSFAWVKVSQGETGRDNKRSEHYHALGRAGIKRGPYHYYNFEKTPQQNASNMIAAAAGLKWELPYVLDAEHGSAGTREATSAALLEFLAIIEAETGRTPVVYTYKSWWDTFTKTKAEFARFPLWIARYPSKYRDGTAPPYGTTTPVPAPWTAFDVWQYSTTNDKLDRNICTAAAYARLLNEPTPKPTEDDMTPEESKMLREIHEQLTVSRDDTAPQGATVRWGVFKSADRIKRVLGKG